MRVRFFDPLRAWFSISVWVWTRDVQIRDKLEGRHSHFFSRFTGRDDGSAVAAGECRFQIDPAAKHGGRQLSPESAGVSAQALHFDLQRFARICPAVWNNR